MSIDESIARNDRAVSICFLFDECFLREMNFESDAKLWVEMRGN